MINGFDKLDNFTIDFQESILGFEEYRYFTIEDIVETPFAYLKGENSKASFVVTSPFHWYSDYSFEIDEGTRINLNLQDPKDTLILSIVTIKENLHQSTINLLAPLVVNVLNGRGVQYLIQRQQGDYDIAMPLMRKE